MPKLTPHTANTILYCQAWAATVAFYRDHLGLPMTHTSDWFVEFALTTTARLSIADEGRELDRERLVQAEVGAQLRALFAAVDSA